MTFTNMSTPASFGVEWISRDSRTRFQLANPRGTTALILGLKIDGATEWFTVRMVAPERFGMDRPPRTFDEFREIAEAYVNASTPPEENESS